MGRIDAQLKALGLELPPPGAPRLNVPLVPAVRVGNLLFLSGAGPAPGPDGKRYVGKLGRDLTVEEGYAAARQCALSLLSALKQELGDLDRVKRIVKLLAMVNSTEDFTDQPRVAHGCSDLLVQLWGESGRHARSAVGMAQLPGGIPVEIEMIVEVE